MGVWDEAEKNVSVWDLAENKSNANPEQWKKNISSIANFALPAVGGITGAVLGAPAAIASGPMAPAVEVGAGTLGIAGGKAAARGLDSLLGITNDSGIVNEVSNVVRDIPEAAKDLAIGSIIPVGIGMAAKAGIGKLANSRLPEELQRSAFKDTKGKTLAIKDENLASTLKHDIGPNREGYDRAFDILNKAGNQTASEIENAGANNIPPLTMDEVLQRTYPTIQKLSQQVAPNEDLSAAKTAIDQFKEHPLLPKDTIGTGKFNPITDEEIMKQVSTGQIPVYIAQQIKQGTYQQLKGKFGQLGNARVETEKDLARGLKEGIESRIPVSDSNKTSSEILGALPMIEQAISRIERRDLTGIGSNIAMTAGKAATGSNLVGLISGFARSVYEHPNVKSKIARELYKVRNETGIDPYPNVTKLLGMEY